jgi:2-hydroxy-6-oxonona-2,4-dienedioate hydrolase
MMQRRTFLASSLAGLAGLIAGGYAWRAFSADMAAERSRISVGSRVVQSRFGAIEYGIAGEGPPVIMLHGTGGGFDQGLSMTRRLAGMGHQIIAPSRFGYLRSSMPSDASSSVQADAVADLMDQLGIARAPVLGGSAGARAALALAEQHPDRCAALVAIVPATSVPGRSPPMPSPLGAAIMEYALRSDLLFWAGMKLAKDTMIRTLLATDPALVHKASPEDQDRVESILREILPVSARVDGLLNDARLSLDPEPFDFATINAPVLAISLEDDRFQTLESAQHIAATAPNARLVTYPTGGHVYVGREAELFVEIDAFLKAD